MSRGRACSFELADRARACSLGRGRARSRRALRLRVVQGHPKLGLIRLVDHTACRVLVARVLARGPAHQESLGDLELPFAIPSVHLIDVSHGPLVSSVPGGFWLQGCHDVGIEPRRAAFFASRAPLQLHDWLLG